MHGQEEISQPLLYDGVFVQLPHSAGTHGAGDMMVNFNFGEEAMESLIFTSPVHLDRYDFSIKEAFHQVLKFNKFLENFGLEL
jgi:hypothetical protein